MNILHYFDNFKTLNTMSLVQECRSYTVSIKNTCRDKNSQDVLDYVFDNLSRKFNLDIKDINKAFDEAYENVGF